MAGIETCYEHIQIGEDRVPRITGTSMKVIELAMERTAYGWSPEEIHFQHPYLSLGQIHAALAYYHDHVEVMERAIQDDLRLSERLRQELGPSRLAAALRSKRTG